jgi:phage terminase large subunit-like protein
LVGPTLHDVREVMIDGPSGLLALAATCSDRADRPRWQASRRRLEWGNGSVAYAYSADEPERLRGPQHHLAWADEFCAWRDPERVLMNLRMGLRLGDAPRLVVTTTPKPTAALRRLLAEARTETTQAGTQANAANLAPAFVSGLEAIYGGTRLAKQELEGLIVEGDGALWSAEDLARCRGSTPPAFERVVVAVDPPASAHGDACGIVVAGRLDGRAFVLADRSLGGLSPLGWGRRVAAAAREFRAEAVVAEANQGGEMVRAVLGQADCVSRIKLVHASRGKRARAEPVAALYEQGRVVHCGAFPALEEEMMALGCDVGGQGSGQGSGRSPDRADALVWVLTELMLGGGAREPRMRVL